MHLMQGEIIQTVEFVFILGSAVILHEVAHGLAALKLGDPTAKLMGRLTLNPLKHIDPIGTVLVPIITKLTLGFPFGWAKPVPVDFTRLHHPKRDMMLVAAAGPATNIVIALAASLFYHLGPDFIAGVVVINLMLAFFNMIPVPPLDGSRVVAGLLPAPLARKYMFLEPFGFIIMIVLINFHALNFLFDFVLLLAYALLGITVIN